MSTYPAVTKDRSSNYRYSLTLDDFPYDAAGVSYFVTVNLAEHQPELTSKDEVADFLIGCLPKSAELAGYAALASVIMPDHMHMIVLNQEGETELPEFIRRFKSYTTNQLWDYGYEGQVWQRKYFERRLNNRNDFNDLLDYLRFNPVEEGLVDAPNEWPWLEIWK